MNGPEWLHSQLTAFTCPACRSHYQAGSIRLLAERDGLFFVDLDCAGCRSHSVAIVTLGMEDAEAEIASVPVVVDRPEDIEPRPTISAGGPVSADDVLEMHEFLAHFRGDVDEMFRAAARQAGGMDHR
ncbi:MAG TPA: hypothetical protein VM305_00420 [Candidatus Limnocylindrales bacterium]|nr:hypothetical protein [Candidatus Limnocylindrales bacterium]